MIGGMQGIPVKQSLPHADLDARVHRTYTMSRGAAAYYVGFSLVWFGSIVGFVIVGQLPHDWSPAHVGAIVVALLFALAPALVMTSTPYQVTLRDEEVCEFRSLFRRKRIRIQQIRSITSDEDDLYIRHDGGKVHLVSIRDFRELLIRLATINPAITFEGWLRQALEEVRAERVTENS